MGFGFVFVFVFVFVGSTLFNDDTVFCACTAHVIKKRNTKKRVDILFT